MPAVERELRGLPTGTGVQLVRSMQLMQAMTAISAALSGLWLAMGDVTRAGQEEARTEALRASFEWDNALLRLGLTAAQRGSMKQSLLAGSRFNVEAMLARIYKTRLPLSEQVYKTAALAAGWVESRVDVGLARGATVDELAKTVRDFVDPKTPGGASYAARRLARTEINAAYHAVTIGHADDKPWVEGMQWSLSGSHPTADICDSYARRDHSQLGVGVFPLGAVPPKPHPQCLCYVFPRLMDETEFVAKFRLGNFDRYIEDAYGT